MQFCHFCWSPSATIPRNPVKVSSGEETGIESDNRLLIRDKLNGWQFLTSCRLIKINPAGDGGDSWSPFHEHDACQNAIIPTTAHLISSEQQVQLPRLRIHGQATDEERSHLERKRRGKVIKMWSQRNGICGQPPIPGAPPSPPPRPPNKADRIRW